MPNKKIDKHMAKFKEKVENYKNKPDMIDYVFNLHPDEVRKIMRRYRFRYYGINQDDE